MASKTNRTQQPEAQDPWDAIEQALDTQLSSLLVLQKSLPKDLVGPQRQVSELKAEADFLQALDGVEKVFQKAEIICKTITDNPDKFQLPTMVVQQRLGKVTQWKTLLHRPREAALRINAARRRAAENRSAEDQARDAHIGSNQNYLQHHQELQNSEIAVQDATADRVLHLVEEMKSTVVDVNDELKLQDAMTQEIDANVSTVQSKLTGLNRKVQTLLDNSSDKTKIIIIVVLMIVLLLMVFILFS